MFTMFLVVFAWPAQEVEAESDPKVMRPFLSENGRITFELQRLRNDRLGALLGPPCGHIKVSLRVARLVVRLLCSILGLPWHPDVFP